MAPITSLQNRRVKQAIKLRDRRGRVQQGRIVIDGAREIIRAFAANVQVVELFVCDSMCTSDESRRVLAAAADANIEIIEVGELVFQKLAFGQRSEGVVGVAETPQHSIAQLELPADALVAVVENIEKPGNLGAIVRSADGAGVAAVIAVGGGTDLYNPAVIRASLGCIFALPVCWAGLDETVAWLRSRGGENLCRAYRGIDRLYGRRFYGPSGHRVGRRGRRFEHCLAKRARYAAAHCHAGRRRQSERLGGGRRSVL